MDPNETLKQLRTLYRDVLARADVEEIDETTVQLAELVESLDSWLIRGGYSPWLEHTSA